MKSKGTIPATVMLALLLATFAVRLPARGVAGNDSSTAGFTGVTFAAESDDAAASAQAFLQASQVLLNPRCVNCHPAGDQPLQGDDSRPHAMNVHRGPEGVGKNGLWCSTCHQGKNLQGAHMPPGGEGWQLPPSEMPMVFEKKTPREICEHFKDPAQNGGRSVQEMLEHVKTGPVVLWGWNPGEGRNPVPMPHEEFMKYMTTWAEKGAVCPE